MIKILMHKRGRWLAGFIIAGCLVFGCVALTLQVQAALLDYRVRTVFAETKDLKMKRVCYGRFLLDVPADAEVSYLGAMIAGWTIATYDNETDEQFTSRIEKKEAQLAGEKNGLGKASLESTHRVDTNGVHGKIHVFAREWIPHMPAGMSGETVRVEAMIRVQQHSFNLTRTLGNDDYLEQLSDLVTQFRSREENEIPNEAGYCFKGGFITEPITVKQSERTNMVVDLQGHPDVSIRLIMTAGITTSETLLDRHDRTSAGDPYRLRFHLFRRGTHVVAEQAGDELLEREHDLNGNYGHRFMWETAHNKTDSVFTPDMSIEMSTGRNLHGTTVDASLTDAEALALWDRMLSSLRVRPVAATKPVAVIPAQVPPGMLTNQRLLRHVPC